MREITGFRDAIKFLRNELASDVGMQTIQILLEVYLSHPEPILHRTLSDLVGVQASTVSRTSRLLGKTYSKDRHGKVEEYGYGLIVSGPDKFESKQFSIKMTRKGLDLMKQVEQKLKLGKE